MSQFLRHLFTGSAVALVALAPALSDTAAAAPTPAPGPGATSPHASGSHGSDPRAAGKGDRDGDKLADDLEAALAARSPGDRVRVIVQGATPADARRAEPSLTVDHSYTLVRAFAGSVAAGRVAALAALSGVTRVELDGVATAAVTP